MNEKRAGTGWVLPGLLCLFGAAYLVGVFYLLLDWLGWQSLPLAWQQASLPLYACGFALVVASVAGALRWKRWGVYGLPHTQRELEVLRSTTFGLSPVPYSVV
jgi:hypothetical protein